MIISIDPGKHACAVALFDGRGWLTHAQMVFDVYKFAVDHRLKSGDACIIEVPRVYPTGYARPNDIVDLAYAAGRAAGFFADPVRVYPSQWKGNVPKKIHSERILSQLTEADKEQILWPGRTLNHNVIDAIGIGLWWLRKEGIR